MLRSTLDSIAGSEVVNTTFFRLGWVGDSEEPALTIHVLGCGTLEDFINLCGEEQPIVRLHCSSLQA